ncbi:MAG TPA: glycoside hydrolase family 88 protein [Ferruginibacter sp.]|nr:glycoside hydrolase family 88 protein [Ferruginibacter sp.]
MTRKIFILFFIQSIVLSLNAQPVSYSRQLAVTVMTMWKDSFSLDGKPPKWTYDQGVILKGFEAIWKQTANPVYFDYMQKSMDFFVTDGGTIKTYKIDEHNIDNVSNGRILLTLYRVTGKEKYWKAATMLREQLRTQPRTNEGGFWHKKIYPYQMWLDGLYMGEPFYAEYAWLSHDDTAFNDIANQFVWMENHARDPKTGLLYHGWDESKQMQWADKQTGLSPNIWARAMGWYVMALADVLEYFPADHPERKSLVDIFKRAMNALENVQDKKTGLWYDIPDKPLEKGNYFESSASSMFVYAAAKGVRLGLLPPAKINMAKKGYEGILKEFIKNEQGQTNLHGTVKVSGLGGKPYRDGSLAYYLGEPVIVNDPKGVGAFIQAATEMEMLPTLALGKGKTVLLDYYFNHETMKDMTGATIQHHYIWEQMDNGGYSLLGNVFNKYGVQTKRLIEPVTTAQLKKADIYIIIDPDWPKENKTPNYILPEHIETIANWVKDGGILMLFANDSNNVEFTRYNQLAGKFGIHFNENYRNMVKGNEYETGTFNITGNPVFKNAKKIYLKEISTLKLSPPARPLLTDKGDIIMALSKYGKGTVFAVGDPWLYNEYIDGRKIPVELENYKAAEDLVQWLIKQTKK